MLSRTPFHERVAAANRTSLWSHWAGHLVVDRYDISEKWEYMALRTAAGLFDTSPLYKYRFHGRGAELFLAGILTRDIRACAPGQAQYTIWCDERGFVDEDGVILRTGRDEFLLTAAEPNLAYFRDRAVGYDVVIDDVSDDYGILAVQGPRSAAILASLDPVVTTLDYFDHAPGNVAGAAITVSRTGFTGDLGYELIVPAHDALAVWDAVVEAGMPHGLTPFGQIALSMARIEAGLLLIGVDFEPSRLAENDAHRSTPVELGLGWMLRGIEDDSRPFIGRRALLRERDAAASRYQMMGLVVDWHDYQRRFTDAGLIPPKDHTPVHEDMMVYDPAGERVGYATSFMYSPMVQQHIALARVVPQLAEPGTEVSLEFTINHRYERVGARVTPTPFYSPARKTAVPAPVGCGQRP